MRKFRPTAVVMVITTCALACGRPNPSTQTATERPSPEATRAASESPARSPTSTSTPRESEVAGIDLELLPAADLGNSGVTGLCDPDPSQTNPDAGETTLSCVDAIDLGLRAFRSVTQAPIERAYVQRVACTSIPCPDSELNRALVSGWTSSSVLTIEIRSPDHTGRFRDDAAARWPDPLSIAAPPIARSQIDGAPPTVANRAPYPFCGRASMGEPPSAVGCFRNAVIAGRPVELLEDVFGTEGEQMLRLYRYDGAGAILRFQQSQGTWTEQVGALVLGANAETWNFDPWTDRPVVP